jgi:hypothetical protein
MSRHIQTIPGKSKQARSTTIHHDAPCHTTAIHLKSNISKHHLQSAVVIRCVPLENHLVTKLDRYWLTLTQPLHLSDFATEHALKHGSSNGSG